MSKFKYDIYYDKISELYKSGAKAKEIVEAIGDERLTVNKIYKLIHRLGLSKSSEKSNPKYDKIDKQALKLLSEGISHREIARQLNVDQQSMTLRLKKKYNIQVLPDGKKYVDSTFFNVIDTEEKAYWLGMMYADGYVNEESGLELCLKDEEHIYKFKSAIKSEHKVSPKYVSVGGKTHTAYRIGIKDKQLMNALIEKGCFRAKSFDIEFPTEEQVPNEFMSAFVRGFFDGDGDISKTGSKKGYRIIGFSCANKLFLEELREFLKDKIDACATIGPSRNLYRLRIHKISKAYEFLDYIYGDATIYLDRKYDLYKNFILPS